MRILQVNKFFYIRGGAERYFFDLSKLLTDRGHTVIHFSMADAKNFSSPFSRYFVRRLDFSQKENLARSLQKFGHLIYSFEAKKKIEQLIKKTRPDLVHLHNITTYLSPSILSVFKKYHLPVVQTLHDYQLICPNYRLYVNGEICERCRVHKYFQAIFHRCVQHSWSMSAAGCLMMYCHWIGGVYKKSVNLFLAPSKFLAIKFKEWQFGGSIVNVPYFVALENYQPCFEAGDYIIYFGRLSREKGIFTLLKAMKNLEKVSLKIVGVGPETENCKLQIVNSKLHQRVELLGYRQTEDLQNLIRKARFVVAPSEWYENSPLVILEAMALGKAVVASKIGGIPELVQEHETGLLFQPGNQAELEDKICYLWNHPEVAVNMGKRGRQVVEEEYGADLHYERIMSVYERVRATPLPLRF